ncbi:surfeit locus protein 1-like [Argopecten irradians]|uniref:surfeit locus protein 1-like n=1 Tax=Argopecten irradians TaxID=31199 RepID=UPI0037222F36
MNKIRNILILWRKMENHPKVESIRSLQSTPRKTQSNMGWWSIVSDASMVAAPAVLCLGTMYFYNDMQNEEKFLEEQVKKDPIPLPANTQHLNNEEMRFRRIKVIGKFDHTMERYIGPRRYLKSIKKDYRIIKKTEGLGMLVVTPFTIKDTGQRILINRGWVSSDRQNSNSRLEGQITDEVEITGVFIQNSEPDMSLISRAQDSNPNVFSKRDLDGLAQSTNSSPIYLDADSASTVEGGPIGGQTTTDVKPWSSFGLTMLFAVFMPFYLVQMRKRKAAAADNKITGLFS